ncbi:MAG: fibronectin type III domain-containing protein, partial [Bacteroidales bacterium]|nr:fibronectin type III domain-containing protein [Bacteroidales bacterium]
MVKHLQRLLLLVVLALPWASNAQSLTDYAFATGVDANKWITVPSTATLLIAPNAQDYGVSTVHNLGFTFSFGEGMYTQFSVNADGNVRFGSTVTGTSNYTTPFSSANASVNNPKINFFGCDGYCDNSHYVRYIHTENANGDSLGVIEFCMGTYTTTTRTNLYKWQVHLYHNGTVEVVYGVAPSVAPAVSRQVGLCENASSGWVVSETHVATAFTNGSSASIASGNWPSEGRYYTFSLPNYSCPRPTSVAISNLTAVGFDVTWVDTSDAQSWIVVLTQGDSVVYNNVENTNSVSFTGLTENTNYTFSVSGLCSNGDTSMARTIQVSTPCLAFNIPYTEDFETFSTVVADPLVNCWDKHTNYTTNYPYASTSQHHSGTKSLYMYSSNTSWTYAVMPQFATAIDSLAVYFWMYKNNTSYPHVMYVGLMSNPNDLTTFDTIAEVSCSALNTWEQKEVVFTGYTGNGTYIAFLSPDGSYSYPYLDDVTVDLAPTCATPAHLAVQDVTTDGATISWVDASEAGDYEVVCVSENDTTVFAASTTTITLTGLTSNTSYDVYVRTICGGSDSSHSAMTSLRTACGLLTSLPYEETFEAYPTGSSSTGSAFVPCWNHLNNGTSYGGYPYVSSSSAYNHTTGGTKGLYWYNATTTGTYGDYQCVVLPGLDTDAIAITGTQLRFWARATSTSYHPVFYVGVMTDPTDITTFQEVATVNVNGTDYTEFIVPFNSFAGVGNYVAVKAVRPTSSWYATVDDFKLENIPPCPEVCDVDVQAVTPGSAVIAWGNRPGAGTITGYNVVVEDVATSTAATYSTTEPRIALTGLDAGTNYSVSVSATCEDGSVGSEAAITFATAGLPCLERDTTSVDEVIFTNSSTGISGCIAYSSWGNTAYQTIYTAAELQAAGMSAGPISGIDLGFTGSTYAKELTIYMGNSNETTITSGTFTSLTGHTQVYGPASHPANTNGWQHYDFDTEFMWDGASSIMLTTFMNQPSGSSHTASTSLTGYYVDAPNKSRTRYQDNTAYTASNLTSGSALSNYNYRASIHFYVGECMVAMECAAPVASVSSIEANQIDLEWIPGYHETAWDVDYRQGTSGAWTNAESSTTDTYATIMGLDANTTYQFRVSALCSDTTLSYILTAKTPCVALDSLPFVETFEGRPTGTSTTGSAFISCWNRLNNGTSYGGYPYVSNSTTYNHTTGGSYGLYWYNSITTGTYGDYQVIVLPGVDTNEYPINTLQLTFWAKASSTSYHPIFTVGVMSNPEDINTFVPVDTVDCGTSTTFTEYLSYFRNYTGNGSYVAIRADRPSSSWYAYVDDIRLEVAPDCPRVDDVYVSNVTATDAELHWTEVADATAWTVVYNRRGNPADSAVTIYATTTDAYLSGLVANSVYNVTITVDCGDDLGGSYDFSFRTACGALTSLPYVENFEGYPSGSSTTGSAFIPCWGHLNNGTSSGGYPYVSISTAYNHTVGGGAGLYWYNTTTVGTYGDYQCIVLPALDTDAVAMNTVQLKFWAKASSTSYYPEFKIGVLSDPTDITTFQPVDTITINGNTAWDEFIVEFSGFTGYGANVAIKADRSTSSWYAYVDDVTLELIPDCPPVENVVVSNITQTSADISFTEVGTASSWTITCTPTGNGDPIVVNTTDTLTTVMGLSGNTQYNVVITVDCGGMVGGSAYTVFRTACSDIDSLPYVMDFENETTGTSTTGSPFVNCWTRHNNGTSYGGYPYVSASTTYNHTAGGTKGLYWYNSTTVGTYGDYEMVVLPGIDTNEIPLNTVQLSFWAKASSTSYSPVLYVGVLSDWNDPTTFQGVDTIHVSSTTNWDEYTTYFSNFTGYGQHIAVMGHRSTGLWYVYADDFTLDLIPDCPPVTNIHVEGVDSNMLTVAWVSNGEETSWNVEYGVHNFVLGTGVSTTVTSLPFVINGLNTNTQYDIYVTPDCGGGSSITEMATFRTANAYVSLPLNATFENASADTYWSLANGTQTNQWHIGTAAYNAGTRGLYISNNNGASHSYDISSITTVWAYCDINVPAAGDYAFSFDWECYGESTLDYIRAALVPVTEDLVAGTALPSGLNATSTPATWIALDGGQKLNLVSSWQTQEGDVHISNPGVYHLAFGFRCDGSVGTMPAPAIDNVQFVQLTCPKPINLTSSNLSQTGIDMTWTEQGSATEWQWTIDGTTINTTFDTSCSITGLNPNTPYTFRVRAICGEGDTSMWAPYPFRTPCGNVAIPYTEDFEAYATGSSTSGSDFIPCWTRLNNGTSYGGYPYVSSSTTYNHTTGGSKGLYWYNTTTTGSYGDYQVIVLPPFDSTINTNVLQLNFWAKASSSSYQPEFKVGVMTNPNDITTFVAVDTLDASNTDWALFEVPLAAYTGTGRYVAIRADRPASSWYAYVDDITLDFAPTCIRPNNVRQNTALAGSSSQLHVIWDTATVVEFQVAYGTPGFTTGTVLTTTNNYITISGLSAMANYEVRVRKICTVGDTSDWSHVILQTAMCDNANEFLSYDPSSSASTTTYAPLGYSFYNYGFVQSLVDSATLAGMTQPVTAWAFSSVDGSQGNYYTHMDVYFANVPETSLSSTWIVPDATHNFVQVLHDADLCYTTGGWHVTGLDTTFTWDGHSSLLVTVNRRHGSYLSGASFNSHATTNVMTHYSYQDGSAYSVTNPSAAGGTTSTGSFVADMKFISCGASCGNPVITDVNYTYNTATVNWVGNGTNYQVAIKESAASAWPTEIDVMGNSYTFTGLNPATHYTVRVRQDCSADSLGYSDWTMETFATDSLPCFAPSALTASNMTNAEATIDWTVNGAESNWDIHVWFAGGFDSIYRVSAHPATVSGFTAGVTYNVAVRALCGSDLLEGDWSDAITFTTAICP